jgi:hypothetical protein
MEDPLRAQLIGPYLVGNKMAKYTNFEDLPLEVLDKLIASGFVDMDAWNEAPTATAFREFMERNPGFDAHGYVISWNRKDSRITIEGLAKRAGVTRSEAIDFVENFRTADEFILHSDHACCWYA